MRFGKTLNSVSTGNQAAFSARGSYTVHLATVKEFQETRIPWNHLVSMMRYPSPFCTWEWIYTWWEQFGNEHELLLLFIYHGDDLCGILPLFRHRVAAVRRWLKGATLYYCGATDVYPDHLDVICAPEDASGCVAAAFDFLAARQSGWAWVHLPMLAQDNDLLRTLGSASCRQEVAIRQVSVAPYITLTGGFEEYLAGLRSKERRKIKLQRKRLIGESEVWYDAFAPAEFETGLRALFELHAKRADAKGITSTFVSPAVFEFHHALLQRMDPNDVILRCLKGRAGVIATLYGFRCGDRIFYYQIGYDPEWSRAYPGIVLITETIREACETGCREYNFLQGDELYKYTFTRKARVLFDCHVYNTTLSGRVAHGAFKLRECLKAAVRRDAEIH